MIGTRRLVLRLWLWLLITTLATVIGAVVAIDLGRRDAEALRAGEAPAREGLAAARQSLVQADSEAITRFHRQDQDRGAEGTDTAGPGVTFRAAVADAGRQLAQVSQADVGGAAAESVQVVNGLLLTYGGLIEQAFRPAVSEDLNLAYLKYAHNFLDEEILPQLDAVRGDMEEARPDPPAGGRQVLWLVPLVVLAGLLVWTQVMLARRFRRTLSAPLLGAFLLLTGLAGTAVVAQGTDGDVAAGRVTLTALVGDYRAKETRTRGNGCDARNRIAERWGEDTTACPPFGEDPVTGRDLLLKANEVSMSAQGAATAATRSLVAVIVLGAAAGLLICAGLWPRFEEYRFRRR